MADLRDDDLGHGHLGDPTYDTSDRKWTWPREIDAGFIVQPIGAPHVAVESPISARYKDHALSLADDTGLVALSAHISELDVSSEHMTRTTEQYDPSIGDLLVFGTVYDNRNHRDLRVACFPSNDARTRLCIMRLHDQRQGWASDKHTYVCVPHLGGENAVWTCPSPIRQIALGEKSPHSQALCLVRTGTAAYLLHVSCFENAASSRSVDRLSISVIGVVPFTSSTLAHVAINPWDGRRFCTLDTTGRWIVWEATIGHHDYNLNKVRQSSTGQLVVLDVQNKPPGPLEWIRASWICDPSLVLVCRRDNVSIADLTAGITSDITAQVFGRRTPAMILDMKRAVMQKDCLFLLTATTVVYARVSRQIRPVDTKNPDVSNLNFERLLSLRHFKDPRDDSLRLALSIYSPDRVMVTISSSYSSFSTWFIMTAEGSRISVTDTTLFLQQDSPRSSLSALVHSARWDSSDNRGLSDSSIAEDYKRAGLMFSVVTNLSNNLQVTQQLVAVVPTTLRNLHVLPPRWRAKVRYTSSRVTKSSFVVDDDDVGDNVDQTVPLDPEPDDEAAGQTFPQVRQRGVDYERVYQMMADDGRRSDRDAVVLLGEVAGLRSSVDGSRRALLSDTVNGIVAMPDLDDAIHAFSRAIESHDPPTMDAPRLLPLSGVSRFLDSSTPDIRSLYDHIIAHWLSPLDADVPGRVRLAREQLARRIATQLCLASHRLAAPHDHASPPSPDISPPPSQPQQQPSQPLSSQLSTPSLSPLSTIDPVPSALARLAAYTTLTPPPTLPTAPLKSMATILAHWPPAPDPDPFPDPDSYSFTTVHARLAAHAAETERLASLRTDRERGAHVRRQARVAARARRQVEERREGVEVPGLVIGGGSQAGQGSQGVGLGSSQSQSRSQSQMPGLGPPSSQGRAVPVRKKARRRTEGF